jgi:hypothetical protein
MNLFNPVQPQNPSPFRSILPSLYALYQLFPFTMTLRCSLRATHAHPFRPSSPTLSLLLHAVRVTIILTTPAAETQCRHRYTPHKKELHILNRCSKSRY